MRTLSSLASAVLGAVRMPRSEPLATPPPAAFLRDSPLRVAERDVALREPRTASAQGRKRLAKSRAPEPSYPSAHQLLPLTVEKMSWHNEVKLGAVAQMMAGSFATAGAPQFHHLASHGPEGAQPIDSSNFLQRMVEHFELNLRLELQNGAKGLDCFGPDDMRIGSCLFSPALNAANEISDETGSSTCDADASDSEFEFEVGEDDGDDKPSEAGLAEPDEYRQMMARIWGEEATDRFMDLSERMQPAVDEHYYRCGDTLAIESLAVAPEHLQKGYGSEILRQVLSDPRRQSGATHVMAITYVNPGFWEKKGMPVVFRQRLDDCLLPDGRCVPGFEVTLHKGPMAEVMRRLEERAEACNTTSPAPETCLRDSGDELAQGEAPSNFFRF